MSFALLLALPAATSILVLDEKESAGDARAIVPVLIQQGFTVTPEASTMERLRTLSAGKTRVHPRLGENINQRAEALHMEGELVAAAEVLDVFLDKLDADPRPTTAMFQLAQKQRIRAANWRLGAAGAKESGRGDTEQGRRALQLLVEALVKNPNLVLDAARYPPKMRRLLEAARLELTHVGRGDLKVTSSVPAAVVFVDGRKIGTTPLHLSDTLPRGSHRLWIEHGGKRSATRSIVIADDQTVVFFDVMLEAVVSGELPVLRAEPSTFRLSRPQIQRLVSTLQTDDVIFLQRSQNSIFAIHVGGQGQLLASAKEAVETGLTTDGRMKPLPAPAWLALTKKLAAGKKDLPLPFSFESLVSPLGTSTLAATDVDRTEHGSNAVSAEDEAGSSVLLWGLGGAGAIALAVALGAAVIGAAVVSVIVLGNGQPGDQPIGTFALEVEP